MSPATATLVLALGFGPESFAEPFEAPYEYARTFAECAVLHEMRAETVTGDAVQRAQAYARASDLLAQMFANQAIHDPAQQEEMLARWREQAMERFRSPAGPAYRAQAMETCGELIAWQEQFFGYAEIYLDSLE
ncbi:hypothetical protein E5163_08770 [Marinicauda algicola]|uniref:Uncharacterized protein n=1 Tax=Marinicauda algicola TaxID=2029849 RepID=A0A4S2H1Q0_9PROT|nr:hypothetical protein [Marinicauda algicola]TGY89201.1 hypothetical protein E5163_08770 [Marinicauda algicola]